MNKKDKYIFITYFERSGSSYLMQILSQYHGVVVCPEGERLVNLFLRKRKKWNRTDLVELFSEDKKLSRWSLNPVLLRQLQEKYLERLGKQNGLDIFLEVLNIYRDQIDKNAEVIVFKAYELSYLMSSTFTKENIDKYNIKVITLIRDGRASYNSMLRSFKFKKRILIDPVYQAIRWRVYSISIKNNKEYCYIEKYENIIGKPKETFQRIINYLGTKQLKKTYDNGYYDLLSEQEKNIHENIKLPPDVSRLTAWEKELNKESQIIFSILAGKCLQYWGYPKKRFYVSIFLLFKIYIRSIYCRLKLFQHKWYFTT